MNKSEDYHPEVYWSKVARIIQNREDNNVIAGDDEPYYRYKRAKFIEKLEGLDFIGKSILELGCGPGGNLNAISKYNYKRLVGVDIAEEMIDLAQKNTSGAELVKINGTDLPFKDKEFDLSFSATVLQHNTDEDMLKNILSELCRVTNRELVLFETVDKKITGTELRLARPVSYYQDLCNIEGFVLKEVEYIATTASYLVCGAIRKLLNPSIRKEGEPLNDTSITLENLFLPLTKRFDTFLKPKKDLAKMVFFRMS
jgi:ubiquinone/menaquinone biosynthesis C-methylase UbiE